MASSPSMLRVTQARSAAAAVLAVLLGIGLFAVLGAHGPDLAAQVVRARIGSSIGATWWPNWFGGVDTLTYSVLSGTVMHHLGVTASAAVAAVAIAAASGLLAGETRRPTLVAVLAGSAAAANLFSGRVTFALGTAVALWSLVLLRSGNSWAGRVLGALAGLLSPLATLTLATVLVGAVSRSSASWRRPLAAAVSLAVIGAPVGIVTVVLHNPSVMPFDTVDLVIGLVAVVLLGWVHRGTPVSRIAVVAGTVVIAAAVIPSAVGVNSIRTLMLATPALLAASPRQHRRLGPALVALALVWPATNLGMDLFEDAGPSSQAAFYQPLLSHLPAAGVHGRLEVLDPASHGGTEWLSSTQALARGWERQIDVAQNPLFYDGQLTAGSYRDWLDDLAVTDVAVPTARLDYGYTAEAALIRAGLPYLTLVWRSADWSLYTVDRPTTLVTGPAVVTRIDPSGIHLTATAAGQLFLRVRWDPLLRLCDTAATLGTAGEPGSRSPSAATAQLAQPARTTLPCDSPIAAGSGLVVRVAHPGDYLLRAGL